MVTSAAKLRGGRQHEPGRASALAALLTLASTGCQILCFDEEPCKRCNDHDVAFLSIRRPSLEAVRVHGEPCGLLCATPGATGAYDQPFGGFPGGVREVSCPDVLIGASAETHSWLGFAVTTSCELEAIFDDGSDPFKTEVTFTSENCCHELCVLGHGDAILVPEP